MSNKSPLVSPISTEKVMRLRREGRNAFAPDVDPAKVNPYRMWFAIEWLEGWKEAKAAWEAECGWEAVEYECNDIVDQSRCEHILGFDAEYPEYENEGAVLLLLRGDNDYPEYACDFCPKCGKDLRKEKANA